jgi:hypothetical protein
MFRFLLIAITCVSAQSTVTHTTATPDTKCTSTDRLFYDESGDMTLDTCKAQCEDTANCVAYAYKASNKKCMGCPQDMTTESASGWDMHDLPIPCSVHCSVSTGVLLATHDTTSGHATISRCYKDTTAAAGCTCDCA